MLYLDIGTHASSDFSKEQVGKYQKTKQQCSESTNIEPTPPFLAAQLASKGANLATKTR